MGAAVVLKSANSRTQKHCIGIETTDSDQSERVKVRFRAQFSACCLIFHQSLMCVPDPSHVLIAQVILGFASAADAGSTITALHSLQLQHLDHMLSCRHAKWIHASLFV
jgi:hypothetical protein